jgi:hypothetical protein
VKLNLGDVGAAPGTILLMSVLMGVTVAQVSSKSEDLGRQFEPGFAFCHSPILCGIFSIWRWSVKLEV